MPHHPRARLLAPAPTFAPCTAHACPMLQVQLLPPAPFPTMDLSHSQHPACATHWCVHLSHNDHQAAANSCAAYIAAHVPADLLAAAAAAAGAAAASSLHEGVTGGPPLLLHQGSPDRQQPHAQLAAPQGASGLLLSRLCMPSPSAHGSSSCVDGTDSPGNAQVGAAARSGLKAMTPIPPR